MFKKDRLRKNWKLIDFSIIGLFIICVFLNFWNLGLKELQGDEASSLLAVIPAMKFYKNPQFLSSLFLFGHAPLRGMMEMPFLYFFGLREFWLYLPNILASLGFFVISFLILKSHFGKKAGLIGSAFLAINGGIVLQRMILGVSFFLLFSSLFLYFLVSFFEKEDRKNWQLALLFLFLAILTYFEAVMFIFPLLFWLAKKDQFKNRETIKGLIFFFVLLFIFLLLWTVIPLLAFKLAYSSNLRNYGIFRIFLRAGTGFKPNISYFFSNFKTYNSLLLTIIVFSGIILSFFNKKSYFYWSFLVIPFVYFSFKEAATIHLFNYLNLLIFISSAGWSWVLDLRIFKNKAILAKGAFYLVLTFAMVANFSFLKEKFYEPSYSPIEGWGKLTKRGLKSTAYQVREETDVCGKMYTNIEGHTARLYFGRRYVQDKEKADFIILKEDLRLDSKREVLFNQKYASFNKLMPYLEICKE